VCIKPPDHSDSRCLREGGERGKTASEWQTEAGGGCEVTKSYWKGPMYKGRGVFKI